MLDAVILHISDLHFSSNQKIKKEKEKIMSSLLDVLIQLEPEWKPNVICVSGDIVDRYDVSAYLLEKYGLRNFHKHWIFQ